MKSRRQKDRLIQSKSQFKDQIVPLRNNCGRWIKNVKDLPNGSKAYLGTRVSGTAQKYRGNATRLARALKRKIKRDFPNIQITGSESFQEKANLNLHRPKFKKLLRNAETSGADYVIFATPSRIARSGEFHPILNSHSVPNEKEWKQIAQMAKREHGLTFTVLHTADTNAEDRDYLARLAKREMTKKLGAKKKAGRKKETKRDRIAKHLDFILESSKSTREISRELLRNTNTKISHMTIARIRAKHREKCKTCNN